MARARLHPFLSRSLRPALRLGAVGLVLAFAFGGLIGPPEAAEAAPSGLDEAQSRADSLAAERDAAVVDLLLTQERLASAETELQGATAELAATDRSLEDARLRRQKAAEDLATVESRLAAQVERTYKAGRTGWWSVIFGSDDFGDLLTRVRMLGRVAAGEAELRDQILAKRQEAEQAVAALESAKDRQQAALDRLDDSRAELAVAVDRQQEVADSLGDRLEAARREVAAAKERMAEINRQAQAERAAKAAASPPTETASRAENPTPGAGAGAEAPAGGSSEAPAGGRKMEAKVTAYGLTGTTATGVGVRRGIIAVDPTVIPLGTRLYVPGYGEGIAADTGSAVKGNVVDVWLPMDEAIAWGTKYLTVTVYY